ncbi:MAG: hypothetical protein ABIZ36_13625 [Gemmatimonadaceae bacterium]
MSTRDTLERSWLLSSFQFHSQLESLSEFSRREWLAIVVFGGGFTALMLIIITLIDQSFFYPRMQTDVLLYYLKAKLLAHSGTSSARLAINLLPYPYASMPGALRAPLVALFPGFDNQLRAIQVLNVVIADALALMSAYIFSWFLPRSRNWMAVGFAFGCVLLSPWWLANIFLVMADAPYAAFSLASMIVAIRLVASPRPLWRPLPILAFAMLFVVAFLFRYTEPIVLVLIVVLLNGRRVGHPIEGRKLLIALAGVALCIGALILANSNAIFGRYMIEPFILLRGVEKQSMFLNFIALAVPEQVIPGFALVFSHPPMISVFTAEFAATKMDAAWSIIGVVITTVVGFGAWRLRDRLLPELLMLLGVLPLLVVMMPSTSRYFMTYQPFFWIAFYEGVRALAARIPSVIRRSIASRSGLLAGLALAIGLAGALLMRGGRARGGAVSRLSRLTSMSEYTRGYTATYRPLKQFLDTLPRDRTFLTSASSSLGRWKAISNLDYYAIDSSITQIATQKDLFLVIECGSADLCAQEAQLEAGTKDEFCAVGEFDYQLVFEARSEKSLAKVYRVRPAP